MGGCAFLGEKCVDPLYTKDLAKYFVKASVKFSFDSDIGFRQKIVPICCSLISASSFLIPAA